MLCITANQILISFLENFTILFNFLRGSHPIGALPKHLLKIFKNVESNQDRRCLRSLIADFINGDILFLNKFLDDFLHVSLNNAIDGLWMAFLTPP
ncbi:unnamed protein product [Brassica napus]|uniref:(rape) hypothetical protein n=1 Tax=Brassica napus TaxID=3708 RepID=A0A816NEX2_BRANA|nr:unnamed protein product [Brassica napus]